MTGITLQRVTLWRICLANALLLDASLQGLLFSFQLALAGRDGPPYWGPNSRHMYLLCAALDVLFVLHQVQRSCWVCNVVHAAAAAAPTDLASDTCISCLRVQVECALRTQAFALSLY